MSPAQPTDSHLDPPVVSPALSEIDLLTARAGDVDLEQARVIFVGKLAGMNKREASKLVREANGLLADDELAADIAVVGEETLPLVESGELLAVLTDQLRQQACEGKIEVITETQFWERLRLVEPQRNVHQLYTPAMLADMIGVPIRVIRRWHRRGLIHPAREVRRLPYFDFREVNTARRLAELMAAGASPEKIERNLESLKQMLPGVDRPLTQLSVLIEGRQMLLREGNGLVEPGGQRRFDFEGAEEAASLAELAPSDEELLADEPTTDELLERASLLEEEGELAAAADVLRLALATGGLRTDACFSLAEALYQLGELAGARERYHVCLELDETFVEARASLGCVLAEQGDTELAIAAFEGALQFHADYPDAHYHLARLFDDLDRTTEALPHWSAFLELAPESPWSDEARERLGV